MAKESLSLTAAEKARRFLEEEKAFRLGELPTESFHPKTERLSHVAGEDLAAGIGMLQSVDDDMPPVARRVLASEGFDCLVNCFIDTLRAGRRAYFTGCGATGRLSILLEAAWRRFWQDFKAKHAELAAGVPDLENRAYSVMAGGDFALIKSVEGFEDFTDFGRHQLREGGIGKGDMVVAITEGGETSFVIGTAWEGLDAGAKVFFVYNNPTDVLCRHVERSQRIIEDPRVGKIDLFTGPMAISGSTRMQATTIELLVVGAAMEEALVRLLGDYLSESQLQELGVHRRSRAESAELFTGLLRELSEKASIANLAAMAGFEEDLYRRHGLVTYFADEYMLDVLTDTTERSPTFMLPPYRRIDDTISPRSWAFAKNPFHSTEDAWWEMLRRRPRGLQWGGDVYKRFGAPAALQANPPRLDNSEIYKFRIGREPDPSRTEGVDSAAVALAVSGEAKSVLQAVMQDAAAYGSTVLLNIGDEVPDHGASRRFHLKCELPSSALALWHHLAVKLVLNTISTATMVRMGRVVGNAMVWVSPSNKKLIDRGCRLIRHVCGCSYETACVALHEAMDEVQSRLACGEEAPSPVALVIDRLGAA